MRSAAWVRSLTCSLASTRDTWFCSAAIVLAAAAQYVGFFALAGLMRPIWLGGV